MLNDDTYILVYTCTLTLARARSRTHTHTFTDNLPNDTLTHPLATNTYTQSRILTLTFTNAHIYTHSHILTLTFTNTHTYPLLEPVETCQLNQWFTGTIGNMPLNHWFSMWALLSTSGFKKIWIAFGLLFGLELAPNKIDGKLCAVFCCLKLYKNTDCFVLYSKFIFISSQHS